MKAPSAPTLHSVTTPGVGTASPARWPLPALGVGEVARSGALQANRSAPAPSASSDAARVCLVDVHDIMPSVERSHGPRPRVWGARDDDGPPVSYLTGIR